MSAEPAIPQDIIEEWMISEGWKKTIADIESIASYESWVASLQIIGWALKPIPLISFFGYACDIASLVIDFMKWTPREEVYKFVLDPANYPKDSANPGLTPPLY